MTRAVFLDALGTLVELEPPWVGLRERVPEEIGDEQLVAAVKAEMAYYREHAHEGRDPDSLADLRERCAELISDELGTPISAQELVDSVRFSPFADAEPALEELRQRGLKLIVVSNWDVSLSSVLENCGIAQLVDGALSSAEAGSPKPDPAIFAGGPGTGGVRAGRGSARRRHPGGGLRRGPRSRHPGAAARPRGRRGRHILAASDHRASVIWPL